MRLVGPATDPAGRQFVLDTYGDERSLYPPDLLVVTPDREFLGRLPYNASADQTIEFLQQILEERPDLAPPVDPLAANSYDLSDPRQAELAELEERWDRGDRASLIAPLKDWLSRFGHDWDHGAATAKTLLGAACYHAGDFMGADKSWNDVVAQHPNHPLRHRAAHNLINAEAWGMPHHPDISDAREPRIGTDVPVALPHPEVRSRNLNMVSSDSRYVAGKSGLPLVEVPAGVFTMGGQPASFERELPLRRVTISHPFFMSAWPVTRGLWRLFQPERVPASTDPLGDDVPITRTTHADAEAFCEFLSSLDGRRYRLPTEAEWEYAARGGLEGAPYPWGYDEPTSDHCNYQYSEGVPVACYPPNGYGLFEMVGNTREWVADRYIETAYSLTPPDVTDPFVPPDDTPDARSPFAIRGGMCGPDSCVYFMRSALRLIGAWAGVRVVADLD